MSKKNKTLRLCTNAIFAAFFVILELISLDIGPNIKITFGGFPIIISAILFGPIDGMAVGFIGSFIGQLLEYGLSATTILWILPAAVRGLLMGLLFKAFKQSKNPTILGVEILISSLVVTILNTLVMFLDALILRYPFEVTVATTIFRFVSSIITAVLYTLLVSVIIKVINIYSSRK